MLCHWQAAKSSQSDFYENQAQNTQESFAKILQKVDLLEGKIRKLEVLLEIELRKISEFLHKHSNLLEMQNEINGKIDHAENKISNNYDFENLTDEEAYKLAYESMANSDFETAEMLFNKFISVFKDSEYLANARFWLGEIYLNKKSYKLAYDNFTIVINSFSDSIKVVNSMLKRAYSLIGLKRYQDAKEQLNSIISNYPKSSAAGIAKQKLLEI